MKYLGAIILLTMGPASYAMGRLPSDPATYADITDVNKRVDTVSNNQNAQQGQINDTNNRVDEIDQTKALIETDVRLFDSKRVTVAVFNSADVRRVKEFAAGLRFTLKLGKSYEERLIESQAAQIEALKRKEGL